MRAMVVARAAVIGALGLGSWLGSSVDAAACECVVTGPPCVGATQAQAVFVGRVAGWVAGEVLFDVERAVRGVKRGRIRIDSGAGNCAFSFKEGERYVVYAHWDQSLGALTTSRCSRTHPLCDPHTRADLAYFDRLQHHHARVGLITGVVVDGTPTVMNITQTRPLAGVVVSASTSDGGRSRSTTTHADGSYMFAGLPAGTWSITAKLPPPFEPHQPVTVTLEGRDGCAEVDVRTRIDERIR
jgi:hypothetical protein